MKILAIHGSPRTVRSTTRRLAALVLEGAEAAGAETEMIDLTDYGVVACTACEACLLTGTCVHEDGAPGIMARMKEADAIVLGSPVYIDNVSGQMKIFFDRLADAMHFQTLAGKYGCSVATTHESGGDEVTAYEDHVLNYLGIVSVGRLSVATAGDAAAVDAVASAARLLGKKLAEAVASGFSDPSQEAVIADNRSYFRAIVEENRDVRPEEYERWVRMGWIG